MTKAIYAPTNRRTGAAVLLALVTAAIGGCGQKAAQQSRTLRFGGSNADVYLSSVSATLNDLPNNLDLELLPAQPILTAATSSDGKEVRAICIRNPRTPEGPFDYLQAVDGNGNFKSLDVQPGDMVRYYVQLDADAAERNIEQRSAISLRVRRLDAVDPENALIIEGGLNIASTDPQRIEIWRYSDDRMDAIRAALTRYERIRQPPAGWEPSPDQAALRQIVERANQWLRNQQHANDEWRVEPLLKELPNDLRAAKGVAAVIAPGALENGVFAEWEARLLEQGAWCRDIAQWARGGALTDLEAADALFDWTIRNVQLDSPGASGMIHHPWQALAYGHGAAAHRAWVFVELCRQQGVDAVVLQPADGGRGKTSWPLIGVLLDDDMHLYDPQLGLPLPGGESTTGTLAELSEQSNDDLLRQLDVEGLAYPFTAEQLASVTACVVATPLQLSRRSARLEAALEGEDFIKLTADVATVAERLKGHPQVKKVSLWHEPFQALVEQFDLKPSLRTQAKNEFEPFASRPLLWKARVLHFQGNKDVRADQRNDPLAQAREGHQDAVRLYQSPSVRPADAELSKVAESERNAAAAAKSAASYWLGLLSYDRGNFTVAAKWLLDRTLKRAPVGKWAHGARYNLARTYEAMERWNDAIATLESDPDDAPQRHGNLIRARLLKDKQAAGADGDANEDGAQEEN